MKLLVLNGPNLNMLGYTGAAPTGEMTLTELNKALARYGTEIREDLELVFYQTNHEGQLIDLVQKAALQYDGLLFNPSALCYYSVALHDAVEHAGLPVVEVHLEDVSRGKEAGQHSIIAEVCAAQFMGRHLDSYKEALDFLMDLVEKR
ncbi:MAG: 3-dehydroquinate dehydratase [Coriobacteriales bacterium]|jgi:3-dehydroquinate dehydratase-2|nr:3-dehydroquinate dehydratase [Coriobacteriales bacterium]